LFRTVKLLRVRVALFLAGGLALVALLYVISQGIQTLARLDVVEQERDQWQRPAEILQALDLKPGGVVVDLGSGAGYFSLKLAPIAGRVWAVDLRKESLAFLWTRARLRGLRDVTVIVGGEDDPRLPSAVDAVLIVNTYHELTQRKAILDHVRRSLVSGGRLVIADRESEHHGLPMASAVEEITREGFEIVRTEDRFLDQPGEGPWWLLVAR
jgi:cyclopropane fatty-acyl-phospholipid synthase-like methyltransferase